MPSSPGSQRRAASQGRDRPLMGAEPALVPKARDGGMWGPGARVGSGSGAATHRLLEAVRQPAVPQDGEHRGRGVFQVLEGVHEDEVQHDVEEAHAHHLRGAAVL